VTELPPFNTKTECSKCGAAYYRLRYQFDYIHTDSELRLVECIVKTCSNCGYRWNERPKDAA
jgi:ribosomal protein L37E